MTPSAMAFERCTACSAAVVAAHESEGWDFVEKACRSPQILEEVSGLEELRRYAQNARVPCMIRHYLSKFVGYGL